MGTIINKITMYMGYKIIVHGLTGSVEVKKDGEELKSFFTEKDAKNWIDRNL